MRDDPQLNSPPLLATIKRLCEGLLSEQMAPTGDKGGFVDDCHVSVTPTLKGPVINGVPDPNVAWSAYASVYDCGLQPVVLHHNYPCGVLVLWSYDPSPRGRLLFAAAAVASIRQTHAAELSGPPMKLRIQFA